MGAALVPVLFAFGGWQQTNFVAEELLQPERDMPRALVIGVIAVVVVYLARQRGVHTRAGNRRTRREHCARGRHDGGGGG